MNLKTFFEHFDTLAEAPNGIKRLRELILDMAVRGKLVPQDPEDEPAENLFVKIAERQKQLVKDKKIKKIKTLPLDPESTEFDGLPNGWKSVRLGAISEKLGAGSTPLGGKNAYVNDGIIFLRSQNVWNDGLRLDGVAKIPLEIHHKMIGTWVQPGDVLLNITGASIGRCAVVPDDFSEGNVSQHVAIVRLLDKRLRYFAHLCLISSLTQARIMAVQVGISREGLSMNSLKDFPVPIPPLAEQKRIVAKVDELMGLCDALESAQQTRNTLRQNLRASALDALMNAPGDTELEAAWAFVRDNWGVICDQTEDIEGFRQSIIQLAVNGRITASLDNPEVVSKVKFGSQIPKRNNKIKIFPVKDYPFALPDSWDWYRLGNLLNDLKYGTSKKCSYSSEGTPVIRIPNINTKVGSVEKSDLKFTQLSEKELHDLCLREDDLLMIRSNGSVSLVGRSAVVEADTSNYAYAGYLVRLRILKDLVFAKYLHLALESTNVRKQIEVPIRTTSGVKNINSTEIANLLIPLPPLTEQKLIVSKVNELMKLCDQVEASLRQQQQKAQALAASAINHLAA